MVVDIAQGTLANKDHLKNYLVYIVVELWVVCMPGVNVHHTHILASHSYGEINQSKA